MPSPERLSLVWDSALSKLILLGGWLGQKAKAGAQGGVQADVHSDAQSGAISGAESSNQSGAQFDAISNA